MSEVTLTTRALPARPGRLTLTRREGERVRLVAETPAGPLVIWVTLTDVSRRLRKAKLTFEAPACVIMREELLPSSERHVEAGGPPQDGGPAKAPGEGRAQEAP